MSTVEQNTKKGLRVRESSKLKFLLEANLLYFWVVLVPNPNFMENSRSVDTHISQTRDFSYIICIKLEAKFKEFEPRLKFETRLKNSWFLLKLYLMFQHLSRR